MSTYELTPAQEALNHETRQPVLWGCLIAFLIINNVAIAARLWIKWGSTVNRKKVTAEDIFVRHPGYQVSWPNWTAVVVDLVLLAFCWTRRTSKILTFDQF